MIFESTTNNMTNSDRMEMEKNRKELRALINSYTFPKGYASWEMFKKSKAERLSAETMKLSHYNMLRGLGLNPKKVMNPSVY